MPQVEGYRPHEAARRVEAREDPTRDEKGVSEGVIPEYDTATVWWTHILSYNPNGERRLVWQARIIRTNAHPTASPMVTSRASVSCARIRLRLPGVQFLRLFHRTEVRLAGSTAAKSRPNDKCFIGLSSPDGDYVIMGP